MIPIGRAACAVVLCGWAALALLSTAASAQAPAADCVDNERQPVVSGGTNGVNSIFAIDLDGDGDVDVLAASANDDKITWYESDGAAEPSFSEHVITTNADGAASVHAGDLDGDGDIDVASASGNDDTIAWYENDGSDPPRFIERSITTDARNAAGVHIADVDNDGDNDVLSASFNDNTIAWHDNDGGDPPTFTEIVLTEAAEGAAAVFAADVVPVPDPVEPEDDDLEVLSASRVDDTIAWYQREVIDELVVWVRRIIDSNAVGATSVFAIDVDEDDVVDVLSASGSDHKVSWYRNDGQDPPSFTKHVITDQASGASAVFAADLDGDGDPDVLSASRFDDKIAWYENLGGGDFGDPTLNQQVITTDAPGAASVYAVDLDQDADGDLDVLAASSVAGAIASNDKIAWHENDGAAEPGFTEWEISGGSVAPAALLAVDVDGDAGQIVDVLIASSVDDTIEWFENDGMDPPSFVPHLLSFDAPGAQDLFWADLDGDLDMDVLAALAGNDSIAWYENLGGGDFGDPATNRRNISLLGAAGASSVFAAHLDDDDIIDVLSASAQDDKIAWYRGEGGGEFGPQIIISDLADGASAVFAADLDGDGDADVLAASALDATIRWFESDLVAQLAEDPPPPDPIPEFTTHIVSTSEFGARDVLAAHMNDDLDLDIVSAAADSDNIAWFGQAEVEGEVVFSPRRAVTFAADFVRELVAVDLDGDGDVDIASASSGDDTIAWYQSDLAQQLASDPPVDDPIPAFTERPVSTTAESARALDVADLDGDGDHDVVTGFLFEIAWHPGGAVEICGGFDVTGGDGGGPDDQIDGSELSWLGGAFGRTCEPGPDPWWLGVDYNEDCQVDGEDLAILTAVGVWGTSTDTDQTERPVCAYTCP
jgi:hypothetical protein